MHPDRATAQLLAATEYALFRDPERASPTDFGWFTHDPRFPWRHDANQLFDVRCGAGDVEALLALLEDCYADTGRPFRKLSLHHAPTATHLLPALRKLGWSCQPCWMMPLEDAPSRPANPAVEVRAVPFDEPDGDREVVTLADGGSLESLRYRQAQDERLGGEALVAYVDGRPVGVTGWFVVDGVARFRPVKTIAAYRGQGVATTMVRHVQDHPAARAADGLVIFCDEDGPMPLYEQLGFVRRHVMWSCLLKLPAYTEA